MSVQLGFFSFVFFDTTEVFIGFEYNEGTVILTIMTHPTLNQITFCKIKISAHVLFKYLEVWFRNGKKEDSKTKMAVRCCLWWLIYCVFRQRCYLFFPFPLMWGSFVALIYFCPRRISNNLTTAQCVIKQSAVKSNLLTGFISKDICRYCCKIFTM